jgi:hypothetical protein
MMAQCDLMVARRMAASVLQSWPFYDSAKECKMLAFLASTCKWAIFDAEKDTLGSLSGYGTPTSAGSSKRRMSFSSNSPPVSPQERVLRCGACGLRALSPWVVEWRDGMENP